MKLLKKTLIILLCIAVLLITVFLIGRYGWKLGRFNACETAGIEQVNIEEGHVRIRWFYPGSLPKGFLGYHAEQVDNTLYVGFKFSAVFGIFETGDFDDGQRACCHRCGVLGISKLYVFSGTLLCESC